MNVLQTLDSLNRGGAETLVLDICRNARKYGINLTFVVTGGGDLENEFRNSGVDYIRLQRKLPIDFKLIKQLKKIIKEKQIEIVHGYQPVEVLHLYLAAKGLNNIKCVMSHQGGGLFAESRKNRIADRILSPLVDANISCSRGLLPWLREEIGVDTKNNFHIIYNGADENRLQPTGNSIRKELGIGENDLLLGMVANFVPTATKDQMTVCRALPQIFAESENAYFVFAGKIAGGGDENFNACVRYCEENGISNKVFFLGGRGDIPDILASLDLFVYSSLHEGLPMAVAETMLAGVPLIVSDIEPLLEATDNGKYAEVFKQKDAEELSEKILKMLKDEKMRRELAEKAREFAKENFSVEAHLKNLKKLYENLLSEKNHANQK